MELFLHNFVFLAHINAAKNVIMCTVTYLPVSQSTCLLTSSRDERLARKAAIFPIYTQTGFCLQILFPKDGEKGGTWIATSSTLTVCLLNGAFKAHTIQPPYRLSRGLVVLAVFNYPSVEAFINEYNLKEIEPFTMILLSHIGHIQLTELRWDGMQKHITVKDPQKPHIWSSATLYTKDMVLQREIWFNQWLQNQLPFTAENVRNFHHKGGKANDAYSIKMERPGELSTISITTIAVETNTISMYYEDLQQKQLSKESIYRMASFQNNEQFLATDV